MPVDKVKKLYDALCENYEMESESEFRKNIQDAGKRKKAYQALVDDGYDMEPYADFEKNLGFVTSEPVQTNNAAASTPQGKNVSAASASTPQGGDSGMFTMSQQEVDFPDFDFKQAEQDALAVGMKKSTPVEKPQLSAQERGDVITSKQKEEASSWRKELQELQDGMSDDERKSWYLNGWENLSDEELYKLKRDHDANMSELEQGKDMSLAGSDWQLSAGQGGIKSGSVRLNQDEHLQRALDKVLKVISEEDAERSKNAVYSPYGDERDMYNAQQAAKLKSAAYIKKKLKDYLMQKNYEEWYKSEREERALDMMSSSKDGLEINQPREYANAAYDLLLKSVDGFVDRYVVDREKSKIGNDATFALSGIEGSIAGNITRGMIYSGEDNRLHDIAMQEYGQHAGIMANVGRSTASYLTDTPFFGMSGELSSQAVKSIAKRGIEEMMSRGLSRAAAERFMAGQLGKSFGQRVGQRVMQGVVGGASNLGTYNAMSEGARQWSYGEFNPTEIASQVAHGAALGAALGITGGAWAEATAKVGGMKKIASNFAGFGIEVGTFTASGELEKWANGESDQINWSKDLLENVGMLVGMKFPKGIVKMFDPSSRPERFNNSEHKEFMDSKSGRELIDAIEGKSLKSVEEAYRDFWSDKDVSFVTKQKTAYTLTKSMVRNTPVVVGYDIEERGGKTYVNTKDATGGVVERIEFDDSGKTEEFCAKLDEAIKNGENVRRSYAVQQAVDEIAAEWNIKKERMDEILTQDKEGDGLSEDEIALLSKSDIESATRGESTGDPLKDEIAKEYVAQLQKEQVREAIKRRYYTLTETNAPDTAEYEGTQFNQLYIDIAQSYDSGYTAEEPQDMQDAKNLYDLRRGKLAEQLGVDVEKVDEEIGDVVSYVEQLQQEGRVDEAQSVLDYTNAKAAYEGMSQRVEDDVETAVAHSNELIDKRVHKTTGMIHPLTLKAKDENGNDKQAYLVSGNVVMMEDGSMVDREKSDQDIIISDAEGNLEYTTSDRILSVDSTIDAEEERRAAQETIRQQYEQTAQAKMSGTITSFNAGDTHVLTEDDGRQFTIELVADAKTGNVDNGDGTVNMTTDGQNVVTVPKEELQRLVDNTNRARVAASEQEKQQREAERKEAAAQAAAAEQKPKPQYKQNDTVVLRLEDGSEVEAEVYEEENEDGAVGVVAKDGMTPIYNGKVSGKIPRDILDRMNKDVDDVAEEEAATESQGTGVEPQVSADEEVSLPTSPEGEGSEVKEPTALERIAKDETTGEPLYTQSDPELAWDSLVEGSDGDADMAREIADSMIRDYEEKLKKAEKKNVRGATPAEKLASAKENKAYKEQLQSEIAAWKQITGVSQRRKAAAVLEAQRKAREEAAERAKKIAAERKAREEAERKAREQREAEEKRRVAEHEKSLLLEGGQPRDVDLEAGLTGGNVQDAITYINTRFNLQGASEFIQKNLDSARSKKAEQETAFWESVSKEQERITSSNTAGAEITFDGTTNAERPVTNGEINELVETGNASPVAVAAGALMGGNLNRASFLGETGMTSADLKGFVGMFKADGGKTVQQIAHSLWEQYPNVFGNDQDARNAVIAAAMSARTKGGLREVISAEVRAMRDSGEEEATRSAENARRGAVEEAYNMPYDDVVAMEENAIPEIIRTYGDLDEEALNNILNEIDYEHNTESSTGDTVLPAEQVTNEAGRAGSTEAGQVEGTGSASAVENGGTDGVGVGNGDRGNQKTEVRRLSENEAKEVIADIEHNATVAPEIELTPENWYAEFGEDGIVETPIGEVKMGENQYLKLASKGREGKLGMIKPTLNNPDIIVEDESEAKNGETERATSYVFVKAFTKEDGSRLYYFTSVTVSKDGKEIVVSNQEKRRNVIANLLMRGNLVWKHADNVSAASDVEQGLYSSQGNLSDPTTEGTVAPQTKDKTSKSVVSGGKVTQLSSNKQEKGEKSEKPLYKIDESPLPDGMTERYRSSIWGDLVDAFNDAMARKNPFNFGKASEEVEKEDYSRFEESYKNIAGGYSFNKDREHLRAFYDYFMEKLDAAVDERGEKPLKNAIETASAEVNTTPTDAQKEAGNYKKGHVKIDGFDVTIEQPKGSVRSGKDANGREWSQTMNNTYGYIRGTEGVDGDHIDVFLSSFPELGDIFVVDQYNEDGTFDEHKVMYGYRDAESAMKDYLANYEKGWGKKRRLDITGVSYDNFKKWIDSSHRKTKPFAEYKNVKTIEKPETESQGTEAPKMSMKEIKDAINSGDAELITKAKAAFLSMAEGNLQKKIGNGENAAYAVASSLFGIEKRLEGGSKNESGKPTVTEVQYDALQELIKRHGMEVYHKAKDVRVGDAVVIDGVIYDVASVGDKDFTAVFYFGYDGSDTKTFSKGKRNFYGVHSGTTPLQKQAETGVRKPTKVQRLAGEAVVEAVKAAGVEVSMDAAEMRRVLEESAGRVQEMAVEEANGRFNEQLEGLTEDNADKVVFSLGRPSAVLLSAGVDDKPMKLYGNKVVKKMKKHGFSLEELRDLPGAVADPIAVFDNYGKDGNRSILTELKTEQGNFLVTVSVGKGHDVDFNVVPSLFGKGEGNIADWINKGFATYINKEKTLSYLHHSALRAVTLDSQEPNSESPEWLKLGAPLAHASTVQEFNSESLDWLAQSPPKGDSSAEQGLNSAAKVIENFENPKISDEILQKMVVFHGSPYSFDAFDHANMGRGEGAQAHGWGTYVAKNRETSLGYASMSSDDYVKYKREDVSSHEENEAAKLIIKFYKRSKSFKDNVEECKEEAKTYIDWFTDDLTRAQNIDSIIESLKGEVDEITLQQLEAERANLSDAKIDSLKNSIKHWEDVYDALGRLYETDFEFPSRNLYEVEIPDYEYESDYIDEQREYSHSEAVEYFADPIEEILSDSSVPYAAEAFELWREGIGNHVKGEELYSELGRHLTNTIVNHHGYEYWLRMQVGSDQLASQLLREAGVKGIKYDGRLDGECYVIFDEKNAKIVNHTQFMKTPRGEVYGFVKDGNMYLDAALLNPNTPIHEYSHLWDNALQKANPELWEHGVQLMKEFMGGKLWEEVKNDPNYADIAHDDNLVASEVKARLTGERGAEYFERAAQEAAQGKDVFEQSDKYAVIAKVKQWLKDVWKATKEWLKKSAFADKWSKEELDKLTAEDFADMTLRDLMEGVNPKEESLKNVRKRDAAYQEAVESGDMEAAQAIVDKAAKAAGYTITAYHGTGRADRVGNVFRPERATSGPMSFFTSDAEIASNYARNKQDTSLAYSDLEDQSYENLIRVRKPGDAHGEGVRLDELWGKVPFSKREELKRKASHVTWDDNAENIIYKESTDRGAGNFAYQLRDAHGNVFKALIDGWLTDGNLYDQEQRFVEVLEKAGVVDFLNEKGLGEAYYVDPEYREEKVYHAYLKMENPFDATKADEGFVAAVEEYYKRNADKYNRESHEADHWDKNSMNFENWAESVRKDIERGITNTWTVVPDYVTDYLKSQGYDGIVDKGGKYHTVQHTVYIPFHSEQVKSADAATYDDNGKLIPLSERFNEGSDDIRFRFVGEKGAESADKAEGGTVRMDNLKVAEDMEQRLADEVAQKKARIEKLRKSEVVEITGDEIEASDDLKQYKKNALDYGKTLQGSYTNKDTGREIQLQRGRRNGGLKEVLQHDLNDVAHIKSVAAIPQIIENAIYIDSMANEDPAKNPDVARYHYYVCGMKIGGEDYTVRMVEAEDVNGNRYYDHKLTHIEKGKLLDELALNPSSTELSSTPESGAATQNRPTNRRETSDAPVSGGKDTKLFSILQVNEQEIAKKIKFATGWERGADGKWRYEEADFGIDDLDLSGNVDYAKRHPDFARYQDLLDRSNKADWGFGEELSADEQTEFDKLSQEYGGYTELHKSSQLKDYVNDDALFAAYPELRDIGVRFDDLEDGYNGKYIPSDREIILNSSLLMQPEQARSTLVHEIQHAIQHIEGFANGGNPNIFAKKEQELYDRISHHSDTVEDCLERTFGDEYNKASYFGNPDVDKFSADLTNEYKGLARYGIEIYFLQHLTDAQREKWNEQHPDMTPEQYIDWIKGEYIRLNDAYELYTDKTPYEKYSGLAGEVEARNASKRMDMTDEERRQSLGLETEDVARGEQIVHYSDSGDNASVVEDKDKVKALDGEKTVKVYRAMQLIDGKLYPPMAAKVGGEFVQPIELGVWEQADEHPELAKDGKFVLNKGNGTSLKAAYNPYLHTSRSPLNDQFSSAWMRDNLVTVEVEVPESELTSGYKADGAKDAVGEVEWKSGPVSGRLAKVGNPRKVILSRYDKPVRVIPDAEVADRIAEMVKEQGIGIPFNTVTPSLREELVKRGVEIIEPQKGNAGDASRAAYEEWLRPATETQGTDGRYRETDGFEDGQVLKVKKNDNGSYSVEGLHDEFTSATAMLDAFRNKYPQYVATLSEDQSGIVVEPWSKYLAGRKRSHREQESADAYGKRQARRAQAAAEHWAEKLHLEDVVEVVTDTSTLKGKKAKSRGWFDPKTGKIVIVLPNHTSVQDVIKTMLHEGVAHLGLRKMFGEHFEDFLDTVYRNVTDDIRFALNSKAYALFMAEGNKRSWKECMRVATEEYMADIAEDTNFERMDSHRNFWQKVKEYFLDMLEKTGIYLGDRLTDDDLRYILWRSYKNLVKEGKSRSVLDIAADVVEDAQMRDRLDINKPATESQGTEGMKVADSDVLYRDGDNKPKTYEERMSEARDAASKAMRAVAGRKSLSADEQEDARRAVKEFIRTALDSKNMPQVGKRELNRIMGLVENVKSVRALRQHLSAAEGIVLDSEIGGHVTAIRNIAKMKKQGKNSGGVSIAKSVDDDTRKVFEYINGRMKELLATPIDAELRAVNADIRSLKAEKSRLEADGMPTDAIDTELAEKEAARKELLDKRDELRVENQGDFGARWKARYDELTAKLNDIDATLTDAEYNELEALSILNTINKADLMSTTDVTDPVTGMKQRSINSLQAEQDNLRLKNMALRGQLKSATESEKSNIRREIAANNSQIDSIDDMMNATKEQQRGLYEQARQQMESLVESGRERLKEQLQREKERRSEIAKNAYEDIKQGKDWKPRDRKGRIKDTSKRGWFSDLLHSAFATPLESFGYMTQKVSKALSGTGYLYRRFMLGDEGVVAAHSAHCAALKRASDLLNAKTQEMFGKDFKELASKCDSIEDSGVYINDPNNDGASVELALSKGTAMYLHQLWNMKDGRMKLEKMGFDDLSIAQLDDFIGEDLSALADWMVDEYYPQLASRMNERHKEIYHTSMAQTENYVPIKIDKQALRGESNMIEGGGNYSESLQKRNGSLINRTVNVLPIDLSRTAFDVLAEHTNTNEEWIAFARVRQDLDYLLSSIAFRETLNANNFGSYRDFEKAARVAVNMPTEPVEPIDNLFNKASAGVIGGAISFKLNTALKQTLSYPAFLAYSQNLGYIKDLGIYALPVMWRSNYKWAEKNLPSFRRRVEEGLAGNSDLQRELSSLSKDAYKSAIEKYSKTGMIPNKIIDAVTCAAGARAVYEYELKRAKARGMNSEEAHTYAARRADITYNDTQQSNVSAFKSPAQTTTRSWVSRMTTTFQQSNLGMTRKALLALNDILKSAKNYGETVKKYSEDMGVGEEEAKKAVNNSIRKAFATLGILGFATKIIWDSGNNIIAGMLGLLGGGDDDDYQEEPEDELKWLKAVMLYAGYLTQGTIGGNVMHDVASGGSYNPFGILTNSEVRYVSTMYDKYGISPEVMVQVLRSGLDLMGVKLDTWANVSLAVEDMVMRGIDANMAMDVALLINDPKSTREKIARSGQEHFEPLEYARVIAEARKQNQDSRLWQIVRGTKPFDDNAFKKAMDEWMRKEIGKESAAKWKDVGDLATKLRKYDTDKLSESEEQELKTAYPEMIQEGYYWKIPEVQSVANKAQKRLNEIAKDDVFRNEAEANRLVKLIAKCRKRCAELMSADKNIDDIDYIDEDAD